MRTDAIPEMKANGLLMRYNSNSIETDQDYDMSTEQSKKGIYLPNNTSHSIVTVPILSIKVSEKQDIMLDPYVEFIEFKCLAEFHIQRVIVDEPGTTRNGSATLYCVLEKKEYICRTQYENDVLNGKAELKDRNGVVLGSFTYRDGCIDGPCILLYESGLIQFKGELKNGYPNGLGYLYSKRGKEVFYGHFEKGIGHRLKIKDKTHPSYYWEKTPSGEILTVAMYDELCIKKNGDCFVFENGVIRKECIVENDEEKKLIREWKGDDMIEYKNGWRVYKGEWIGSIENGFVREGEGTEYENEGNRALYYGGWKNGLREGYGSEFKGGIAVYIGEWKRGMRDGMGKEYNENEEMIRSGRWSKGEYDVTKLFEDGYENDWSVFDTHSLKGIARLIIGNDCLKKTNRFVLDGLNELKSVKIRKKCFCLDEDIGFGSNCLIMNCPQLRELGIGRDSFKYYEVLEVKNLPSLQSIRLDDYVFCNCQLVVFESKRDK